MNKILMGSMLITAVLGLSACSTPADNKVEDTKAEQTSIDEKAREAKEDMDKTTESDDEAASADGALNEGKVAPEMLLKDLDGNEVKLSDFKGKKVYAKFWASWWGICTAGMPEFSKLADMDRDFEIITVVAPGAGGEMSKDEFKKWYKTQEFSNIPVYFDETGDVLSEYGVRAFPTSAFIGSDGVLVGTVPGHMENGRIAEAFSDMVK